MNKLLRAGFRRMFQNRLYYAGLLFSVGTALVAVWARYSSIKKNPMRYVRFGPEARSVEGFVFVLAMVLLFVMAVETSMFLGTDYSDGTIRNKIITGHGRFCIYLSNYLVCASANVSMLLVCYLTAFGVGKQLLTESYMTVGEILQNCLCQCFTVFGFTAVLLLISMLIQNKAAASVLALLLAINLFIMGMSVSSMLSRMQMIESNWIDIEDEEEREARREAILPRYPDYLSGSRRMVVEELDKMLPFNQVMRISNDRSSGDLGAMEGYSVLIVVIAGGFGIRAFRKKDLK